MFCTYPDKVSAHLFAKYKKEKALQSFVSYFSHSHYSLVMSSGKRKPSTADAGAPLGKKPRGVKTTTCDKWVAEYDRELSTSVWLSYERSPSDRSVVENLKCKMCSRFVENSQQQEFF